MNLKDKRLNAYLQAAGKQNSSSNKSNTSKKVQHPVFEKIDLQNNTIIPNEKHSKKEQKKNGLFSSLNRHPDFSNPKINTFPSQGRESDAIASEQIHSVTEALKSGGMLKVPESQKGPDGKESIYRRVAKFLLIIGVDEAAKIMPFLSDEQTEKIIPEIASIRSVSPDEATAILAEFQALMKRAKEGGGVDTARTILSKAFGSKKAEEMLEKTAPVMREKPFSYLKDLEPSQVLFLLKDESVAVRALVLSYLNPQQAAAVINQLPVTEKTEVIYRLAKMDVVIPEVLRRVDQAMHEKMLIQNTTKSQRLDGRNALAEILKRMTPDKEKDILEDLSDDDPELGDDLRSRLFTIDDIINSDDHFIQEQLRKMSEKDIAILLAGKISDFREKILSNVSKVRKQSILEEESIIRPVLRSDSEKVTSQFFSVLRNAFETGALFVKGRSEDEYVD